MRISLFTIIFYFTFFFLLLLLNLIHFLFFNFVLVIIINLILNNLILRLFLIHIISITLFRFRRKGTKRIILRLWTLNLNLLKYIILMNYLIIHQIIIIKLLVYNGGLVFDFAVRILFWRAFAVWMYGVLIWFILFFLMKLFFDYVFRLLL